MALGRRYILVLALTLVALLAASVAFNHFLKVREGKPVSYSPDIDYFRVDYFKEVREKKPGLVVIGSSRVDAYRNHPFGDPRVVPQIRSEFDWGEDLREFAVLTLYNASATEVARAVRASNATAYAKQVMVGLDFFASNAFFSVSGNYPVDTTHYGRAFFLGYASWQGLINRVIKRFDLATTRYVAPVGEMGDAELALARFFRKLFENGSRLSALAYPFTDRSPAREALRAVLHEIELGNTKNAYLVIMPAQAWALEAIELSGLWPQLEAWKRMVAEEVDLFNARLPEKKVALWDFNGHNCVSTEPTKIASARKMWADVDHHKPIVAKAIVAKMHGLPLPASPLPECDWGDFGIHLTGKNIETHLGRLREQKAAYEQSRRAEMETVKSIFARSQQQSYRHKLF